MTDADGPRLLLVEDHELLAQSLAVAARAEGMEVHAVQPASDQDVIDAVERHRPDLVLLDLDLGEAVGSGDRFVPAMRAQGAQVLVVSGVEDPDVIAAALESGALGFVHKSQPFDDLLEAIRRAVAGEPVNAAEQRTAMLVGLQTRRAEEAARLRDFDLLTPRESQVLAALMAGKQVEVIAREAVLSEATIRSQVRAVLMKLGVTSQLAAVALAHRTGWRPPA